ncbi:MAG: hypothetical protein ACLSWI_08235 [Candidatus Gastranaerophilaceae bacterium]
MKSLGKAFGDFKNILYKNYGENPGKMLVHTGVLGWILSSLAQVGAVVFNDKISTKQKTFLIPQEIADAAVNILSFYVVTSSVKNLASKLVSTGKLSTKNIRHFLEKEGITTKGKNKLDYIGNIKFNIENLDNFSAIKNEYKSFKNGIDVIASTIGSIISCNIITPIARNKYASIKQKETMAKINKRDENSVQSPKGIKMVDYQRLAYMKFQSKGSLKV